MEFMYKSLKYPAKLVISAEALHEADSILVKLTKKADGWSLVNDGDEIVKPLKRGKKRSARNA